MSQKGKGWKTRKEKKENTHTSWTLLLCWFLPETRRLFFKVFMLIQQCQEENVICWKDIIQYKAHLHFFFAKFTYLISSRQVKEYNNIAQIAFFSTN